MKIEVGFVIEPVFLCDSLSEKLASAGIFKIPIAASSLADLQQQINRNANLPEIILVDINLPLIGGIETVIWLREQHSVVRVIALCNDVHDRAIITMMKAGCCSYLSKYIQRSDLKKALQAVHLKGYFNPDRSNPLAELLFKRMRNHVPIHLSEQEKLFLKMTCTELSYEHILLEMNISEKTGNKLIDSLFRNFGVRSRMGVVLEALQQGLVSSSLGETHTSLPGK